jgi:hypothetical protein
MLAPLLLVRQPTCVSPAASSQGREWLSPLPRSRHFVNGGGLGRGLLCNPDQQIRNRWIDLLEALALLLHVGLRVVLYHAGAIVVG